LGHGGPQGRQQGDQIRVTHPVPRSHPHPGLRCVLPGGGTATVGSSRGRPTSGIDPPRLASPAYEGARHIRNRYVHPKLTTIHVPSIARPRGEAMSLREDATALRDELAALRRDLHQIPEIGLHLPKTQERVL